MFDALRDVVGGGESNFIESNRSRGDNLGLRLNRLNLEIDDWNETEHESKDAALDVMSAFKQSEEQHKEYKYFFDKWKKNVENTEKSELFLIKSSTKVLLGTGNASVHEFGFNLMYPFGVPYISGSSLKGLVSSYLHKRGGNDWSKESDSAPKSASQVQLFGGDFENKSYIGSVVFSDAWMKPVNDTWFMGDIINVHHQKYYSGDRMPDGMENPIPVKIVALKPDIQFLVAFHGDEKERKFIKEVLIKALEEEGIGGKTAVGYGRFEYVKSEHERLDEIKYYSIEKLKGLTTGDKLDKNKIYDNAVRYALERNKISKELEHKYKKYSPLRYVRMKIQEQVNISLDEINQILDKQSLKNLNKYPNPKSSEDGKFIFNYVLKNFDLKPVEIANNKLLNQIVDIWEGNYITEENIENIICDLDSRVLANDLKIWIENSFLSNKKNALELLKMQLEDL